MTANYNSAPSPGFEDNGPAVVHDTTSAASPELEKHADVLLRPQDKEASQPGAPGETHIIPVQEYQSGMKLLLVNLSLCLSVFLAALV